MLIASPLMAAPAIDYLFPDGAQRGTTIQTTATGKFDAWPVSIWVDSPGIHFTCGKDKGQFSVQCDKDAPLGPHLVRFYAPDGTSYPRVFVIGADPELLEVEPNNTPRDAQKITALPVTINGRLQQYQDTDCFAAKLSAGQTLVASLQIRRLGAAIDPLMHVLDADGYELAFSHDGLGRDPLLAFTAPRSGTYIVRIAGFHEPPDTQVALVGDPSCIYRLHLTTGPFINHVTPAGLQRGTQATLKAMGWNIPPAGIDFPVDAASVPHFFDHVMVPTPGSESIRVEVGDGLEMSAARAAGKALAAPAYVNGCLEKIGQQNSYQIAAHKGEVFHFSVSASVMASALDPVINMETEKNKWVEGAADWTAPEDKTYHITIADQFRKGGPAYFYRLRIEHPKPAIQVNPNSPAYVIGPGKTIDAVVTGTRIAGHNTPLTAIATGLPPGVTATSADLPAGGGAVALKITAAPDAKAFAGVIHLALVSADPLRPEVDTALFNLRTEKDITQQMIDLCEPWLTVLPPPPPATTQASTKPAKK